MMDLATPGWCNQVISEVAEMLNQLASFPGAITGAVMFDDFFTDVPMGTSTRCQDKLLFLVG